DDETFASAQAVLQKMREATKNRPRPQKSEFTSKIYCPYCGKAYKRNTSNGSVGWNCSTFLSQGKAYCHGKKIPEATLKAVCAEVLGTGDYNSMVFDTLIERIEVPEDNHLRFIFKDGRTVERTWADRSRRES
ncbi:MAG TPA: zinc ribbon domain-containing protein, partial [Oscillospiraceae bacterium]|nr:zinc ribbon domain-containing protein [Oscillospiraceae bacterium]